MSSYDPRMLQCFGGPADGQIARVPTGATEVQVNGVLCFYDLRLGEYRQTTIHQARYVPTVIPIGEGKLYRSRLVLRYTPPEDHEPDGA